MNIVGIAKLFDAFLGYEYSWHCSTFYYIYIKNVGFVQLFDAFLGYEYSWHCSTF
jgi:hypothetical protein